MKTFTLILITIVTNFSSFSQVPESCDCIIDTSGYASYIQTLNPDENAIFQLHVNNSFAVAYGVIDSNTPDSIQNLIDNYPLVTTIIMYACPGSDDDDANLEASILIYNHGYKMFLPNNGWVASGATDMILAGSIRIIEETTESVGVHSWSDGTNEGTDFPIGHIKHLPYIDYYKSLGFSQLEAEDFYYFTINAAAANDIYWMTEAEIDQYKIRTCWYATHPTYTVLKIGNTLTTNLNNANANYEWIDCENTIVLTNNLEQSFSPIFSGDFAVIVNENNCVDTSSCFNVIVADVIESNFINRPVLYPNPSLGAFTIDMQKQYQKTTVSLMDLSGNNIHTFNYNHLQILPLDLNIPSGIYLLKIVSNEKSAVVRIVKN